MSCCQTGSPSCTVLPHLDHQPAAAKVGMKSSCANMSLYTVPGLITPGPADHRRHAEATFPVGRLLTSERGAATIGPAHHLGPVVGGVHDDGVVRDAQVVEFLQQLAHMPVVLDHAVGVKPRPVLPSRFLLQVRKDVHARAVELAEERLAGLVLAVDEVQRRGEEFLIHCLHALAGQRAGILDLAVCRALRITPRGPKRLRNSGFLG